MSITHLTRVTAFPHLLRKIAFIASSASRRDFSESNISTELAAMGVVLINFGVTVTGSTADAGMRLGAMSRRLPMNVGSGTC